MDVTIMMMKKKKMINRNLAIRPEAQVAVPSCLDHGAPCHRAVRARRAEPRPLQHVQTVEAHVGSIDEHVTIRAVKWQLVLQTTTPPAQVD